MGRYYGCLHELLMCMGVFLLLQGLIAKNLEDWSLLFQLVKYFDEFFVALIFLVIIVLPWFIKGQRPSKTGIEWLLSLFLLIGIISSIKAKVPHFILASQFLLYIKGFLFFGIFANLPIGKMILHKHIRFFFYAGLLILALGFIDLVAPELFRKVTGNMGYEPISGGILPVKSLFIHPGVFGWFMCFITLYCLAFFIVFGTHSYLFTGLAFCIGCILSMRAKALGGLVAGILAGLSTLPLTKRIEKGFIIVVVIICISIPVWPKLYRLYQEKFSEYVEVEEPMLVARHALYITSVEIAKDYFPFGAGFGRYGSWLSRKYYSPLYDEYNLSNVYGMTEEKPSFINDTFWPMILGETGFIGLALFAGILLSFFRTIYKQIKSENDKFIKAFQLGTFMVLIESLVESIAQSVYVGPPMYYFVFGAIGVCYSLKHTSRLAPKRI